MEPEQSIVEMPGRAVQAQTPQVGLAAQTEVALGV